MLMALFFPALLVHFLRVSAREDVNKMSLLNLATVFGPSLLRPPVAGVGSGGPRVDISQEVVVQVSTEHKPDIIYSIFTSENQFLSVGL